ncbi:hypothetical protein BRD56_13010 [Thermoplasmatales archaeon SW_10_69_26]|nr:MAG: hypothetical protein BRD56_13010 [Thermoplasmatales archaeon SW_10_69_26]
MTRTNPRLALLLTIVLAVSGVALFAANVGGQSSDTVPVDFQSSGLGKTALHFDREGGGADCTPTAEPIDAGGEEEADVNPLCQLRIQPPGDQGSPDSERRSVQSGDPSGEAGAEAEDPIRFALDADPDDGFSPDRIPDGAAFNFSIRSTASSLTTVFYYSSDAVCQEGVPFGAGEQQPIDFVVRYHKVTEDELQNDEASFEDPFASTSKTVCGNGASQISAANADRVSVDTTLDQPVSFAQDEAIVTEIVAVNSDADDQNFEWEMYFGDRDYDTRTEVRSPESVQHAVWAADRTGTVRDNFDPDSPDGLVPHLALRSPFGSDAILSGVYDAQIRDPEGDLVDLVTDDEDTTTALGLTEKEDLTIRGGAQKIFEIETPEDQTQPWDYPSDVQPGAYTIEIEGEVIQDTDKTFTRSVAMGAFAFDLAPEDGESTDHRLKQGSSTTYLLEVANRGTESDSYAIDASFEFSEGGDTWAVDLVGVDQNDRVTVDGGDVALLRVTITPPDGVSLGDRARVLVTADSTTSDAQQNVTLEAQVTDRTVRDVGGFALSDEDNRKQIRVGQTTSLRAFAWNQGTAQDGISVQVDQNSTPEEFDVSVPQAAVTGVSPGNVGSFTIDVTPSDVQEGDEHTFDVEVQSRAEPQAVDTFTVHTIVTAERSVEIVGLDHQNDESLDSLRFSRFNRSNEDVNGDERSGYCEPGVRDEVQRPDECDEFHNFTYHRAVVTNTGDQPEVVDLSLLPEDGRTESIPSPNDCQPLLDTRIQRMEEDRGIDPVAIVDGIDTDAPGTESTVSDVQLDPGESQVVYLRLGYDGKTSIWEDLGEFSECSQESFHATILASLDNGETKTLSTETRFPYENTQDMDEDAQARLALLDSFTREDGTVAELPGRTGLELGETTTINFTLSLQQGHHDQAQVELANDNEIQDLLADGWEIRLDGVDVPVDREGPREITVPGDVAFADNDSAERSVGYVSGGDVTLGLELTPPESGAQENERFGFTVLAKSDEVPDEDDSIGIATQIGRTFGFELDRGTQTIRAHPGDEVAFGLAIANSGATRDGFAVETSSDNADPTAQPDSPTISSTSEKTSSIRVDVPTSAQARNSIDLSASVSAERGTPSDPSDDLGPKTADYTINVVEAKQLTMEAERSIASVSPGGQTALNFSITNQGSTTKELQITQPVGPRDWDTSLRTADGEPSPDNVTIGPEETITQTVLVEAPSSVTEGSTYPFVIEATNLDDNDEFAVARAEAIAQGETAIALEIDRNQTEVVDAGETTEFPILVRNPGTSPTSYKLGATFESEDWIAQFVDASSGTVLGNDTINVPEDEFRRVVVEVQAPNDAEQGHVETIDVGAFARGQRSVEDQVTLTAEIHRYGVEIDVTGAQAKDVAPGDATTFQVDLTNTGNGEDQIQLAFDEPEGQDAGYEVTSSLTDDTTPTLEAGETLENVTVEVHIPSPNPEDAPVAREGGVTTLIEARSSVDGSGGNVPTSTAEVTTRLVDYVLDDIDGDSAFEVALDLNRDLSDGYEIFRDQDTQLIERGELNATQSTASSSLYVIDGDDDGRAEHVIDTDDDGVGNVYFDPDRARTFDIPFTFDATGDAQSEHPIDVDFDGVIDRVFDPANEELRKTANLDLSGDGRADVLVDTNGDTRFDKYVNPHRDPVVVTEVERDGDLYKVDTDGSGQIDTHYDVSTQSVQDAETANLQTFLGSYWYVIVAFLAVVVAFGVIFYRRL